MAGYLDPVSQWKSRKYNCIRNENIIINNKSKVTHHINNTKPMWPTHHSCAQPIHLVHWSSSIYQNGLAVPNPGLHICCIWSRHIQSHDIQQIMRWLCHVDETQQSRNSCPWLPMNQVKSMCTCVMWWPHRFAVMLRHLAFIGLLFFKQMIHLIFLRFS